MSIAWISKSDVAHNAHVSFITRLPSSRSNRPVGMVHDIAWGNKNTDSIASLSGLALPSCSPSGFENAFLNKVHITV
jgi:hypothetical protein